MAKLQATELYEDNAGGLHLHIGGKVLTLPDGMNTTYRQDINDQSWIPEWCDQHEDDVEKFDDFEATWLYDSQGYLKTDGAIKLIATSDSQGIVAVEPNSAGRCGGQYLRDIYVHATDERGNRTVCGIDIEAISVPVAETDEDFLSWIDDSVEKSSFRLDYQPVTVCPACLSRF